jgi:hypothetical protein
MRAPILFTCFWLGACGPKPAAAPPTQPPAPRPETPKPETPPEPPAKKPDPISDTAKPGSKDPVCATKQDFGPATLDATQAAARYGANAKSYRDAPTTKQKPVEVCGIRASRQWLGKTACADGSSGQQLGRVGSVGSGGRCEAIIDLYRVKCPEAEYEVFIDIYMCGPGESF